MTNSTRCALLAKLACTTLSHVVQKITPPSANNFLKLFFALFAILALGVTNAWGADFTLTSANSVTVDGVTVTFAKGSGSTAPTWYAAGLRLYAKNTVTITSESEITSIAFDWEKQGSKTFASVSANTGSYSHPSAAGKGTWTGSSKSVIFTLASTSGVQLQLNTLSVTTANGGSTEPPTPTTQYTVKWYTAIGSSDDVKYDEGATITKPATDPTMSGYKFMGWTDQCSVAEDGTGFTALTNFGTADSDKEFYAVFAVATTTGGGGTTTETLKGSEVTYSSTSSGYKSFTATTASGTWTGTANYNTQGYIQINKNSKNYHIGSPTFASNVTSIKITTTNNSAANRTFYICSSNSTAEPTSGDLGSHKTTTANESFTIDLTKDAKQFYIYSSGAVYISQIDVTYSGGGTTTYDNYITTCASGIEYIELGDDFEWSAAEAEVTIDATDNEFPTLTNTHNVPVKYSSSDDAIATIAADGAVTLKKEGTVTITAKYEGGTSAGTGKEYKAKSVDYTLTVKPAPLEPIAGGVIDILDNDWSGLTTSDYATVAAKTAANTGHSNAQYTAQCAGSNSSIQLRSNNSNSGIVSTVSGGLVKRVEIEWNDATSTDRTLNIYGSNTPYTNPTDLYDTNKDGDKLGTIVKGTSTYLEISEDYRYIGLRSASGAMYLAKVTITWLPINSKVTVDNEIANGSISVSGAADLNAVAAGTELTLSNTPATGYKLTAYDVYKTGEETTKVTVTDGNTFVMPEFDVTISATFELAKTLTGIEITTPATQNTFWQGETFNSIGLKVTAHFDGAGNEDVTDKVTVNGSTVNAGTVAVEVSFTEGSTTKTTNYDITVKAIPNTKETAYSVADAYDIIDKLGTASGVFISGIISQVDSYNSTYKSITYWISADGTTTEQLQVYSGKGLESADFDAVTDLTVGDKVIVCGNLKKYNETYEFDKNNYLASHTPTTKDPAGLAYATTEYTANVGEAFATPELTNPHNLVVTYSTSDASKATVDENTGAVTIVAAGVVTITAATTGDATHDAGSAFYTITISNPAMAVATLPFAFNSGKADIESTAGMTQNGLGSDYTASNSQLKFDDTDDWLVIHFDTKPDQLMYNIKNNTCSGGEFSVQESTDGKTYSTICTYQDEFESAPNALHTLQATSRYVKFIYTEKSSGNVGLGNIKITKLDTREEAGLEWSTTSYDTYYGDETLAPTLTNPYGLNITYSSSNEDVATIDGAGKLTLKNTGTTTITATFEGNENYKASEVSYTLSYASKWALTYTSNVEVGNNAVTINTTDYEAIKTGTSDRYGSTTVVVPVSTHTLHFHAAGWGKDEDVKLIVKNGETELGTFVLSKDDGVKNSSPFILEGTPYLQYYSVSLTNITTETEITFEASTSGEGKRFVLYGVNQEGGVLPELNRIEIAGEATELTYEVGDVFNPAGLSVNAIYTLAGVEHETVAVDAEDVEWSFDPATIAAETSQVEVTATYEGKTATKTITGLTVNAQTPEITVTPTSIDWGTVNKDSEASCQVTVTLKAVENATIALSGTNPTNFSVDRTALTETGTIVVSANTSSIGTYTATITISDDAELAEAKKISIRIVVEGTDAVNGDWQLVTDASTLKAGDKIIIASVAVEDKYYTMGKQNSNNRGAVISTVSETQLTPSLGTSVLTLVDAGDGKYALQTSNGSYLSAAGTSNNNYLREDANYEENNEKWTISITNNIATIKASSNNRNWIRFNLNNGGSPLFSCYGSGQTDIALYKRVPDYTRTGLSQGAYGTICLSNNIEALFGATLYTVAGKETNGRVVFDEVPISETEEGKPYIFLAESSHIEVYYGTETATEAGKHNSLQGTFEEIAIAETNALTGNYMVVNNIIKKCRARCGLGANRAYFIATELENLVTAPAKMPGRRRVSMGMTGENGTTDLENITTTDTPVKVIENGQLIIIRDGVKYNVQGVRL